MMRSVRMFLTYFFLPVLSKTSAQITCLLMLTANNQNTIQQVKSKRLMSHLENNCPYVWSNICASCYFR